MPTQERLGAMSVLSTYGGGVPDERVLRVLLSSIARVQYSARAAKCAWVGAISEAEGRAELRTLEVRRGQPAQR